jgi:Septum formation
VTASKGWTKPATSLTRVDCRSPHEWEVNGKFNLSGGRYPGDTAVDKAGDARCKKYFARYVGIDWDSSVYGYGWLKSAWSGSVRYAVRTVSSAGLRLLIFVGLRTGDPEPQPFAGRSGS